MKYWIRLALQHLMVWINLLVLIDGIDPRIINNLSLFDLYFTLPKKIGSELGIRTDNCRGYNVDQSI